MNAFSVMECCSCRACSSGSNGSAGGLSDGRILNVFKPLKEAMNFVRPGGTRFDDSCNGCNQALNDCFQNSMHSVN